MSCIVYQTDKKTGVKYAYESISFWDKDKQQPRSKRKYLGKVDPVTGEIVKSRKNALTGYDQETINELKNEILQKDSQIKNLTENLACAIKEIDSLKKTIRKIASLTSDFQKK